MSSPTAPTTPPDEVCLSLKMPSTNPAFGPAQIRELTSISFAKATRLRDVVSSEVSKYPAANTMCACIDIMPWFSRMTLGVIGLADNSTCHVQIGLNCNFDALNANEKPNELNEAFSTMLNAVQAWISPLHRIPTDSRTEDPGFADVRWRASVASSLQTPKRSSTLRFLHSWLWGMQTTRYEYDAVFYSAFAGLAMSAIAPLLLGHYMLVTVAPEVRTKLREELLSVDTETPSMDDLMALLYLDAVVRGTLRVVVKDDVLPLEKPFTDRISKGDQSFILILVMNRSEELWGSDPHEFNPERWQDLPESVCHIPGVWGDMLSFLGGPRACIGYRFSVIEMKANLFSIVAAPNLNLRYPASEICEKVTVVQRPALRGDLTNKSQLPLLVKPYQKE
ncbi:cytochrome P450 [Melanogaster broomeanus]|nr:cytochrome P450 [Melanogaster broomeanus]